MDCVVPGLYRGAAAAAEKQGEAAYQLGVEYQPLVAVSNGATCAYEALARFRQGPLLRSPQAVFDRLHDVPAQLFAMEQRVTRLQLHQRPSELALFINLDPHAAAAYGALDHRNPLCALLLQQPQPVVIELIENTSVTDATISQALLQLFQAAGLQLAIDDLGAPQSLLSLPLLMGVDFVKFDRCWLRESRQGSALALLRSLLAYVRTAGKTSVLEGIETHADLAFARELGVDWVQGYLFRERFIGHWSEERVRLGSNDA